ncbi:unnamed protein product [Bemisia tabaci]|uniref:Uncharacterized protein n=1 Tax=Bemisia tabaci TaxID=7038 RepID=A0A9P0A7D5_BEMTA|nr:unnamed protein product [Bemisia tabaci]
MLRSTCSLLIHILSQKAALSLDSRRQLSQVEYRQFSVKMGEENLNSQINWEELLASGVPISLDVMDHVPDGDYTIVLVDTSDSSQPSALPLQDSVLQNPVFDFTKPSSSLTLQESSFSVLVDTSDSSQPSALPLQDSILQNPVFDFTKPSSSSLTLQESIFQDPVVEPTKPSSSILQTSPLSSQNSIKIDSPKLKKKRINKRQIKKMATDAGCNKSMKPNPCYNNTSCYKNCKNILEEDRKIIFVEYHGLKDYNAKKNWLLSRMTQVPVKRHRKKGGESSRSFNTEYRLNINGIEQIVCLKFLCATLDVSPMAFRHALTTSSSGNHAKTDTRGKHNPSKQN